MNRKPSCWKLAIRFKDMDMSGGDAVDGPRWTGKYIDVEKVVFVVATTEDLAVAAARSLFHDHQKPALETVAKVCDVNAVVAL